jgi:hypothetical protein
MVVLRSTKINFGDSDVKLKERKSFFLRWQQAKNKLQKGRKREKQFSVA